MPVKVGKSYVSEAAYSYAKAQVDKENNEEAKDSDVLKSLAKKFPQLKFSVGTSPFSGTGTNNLSISPKILRQMEQDPDKRLEYEALIYDIATLDAPTNTPGRTIQAHGFIIDDNGGLRGWSIGTFDDGSRRTQSSLKRSDKKNWWQQLLEPPKKKKNAKTKHDEGQRAAKVDISPKGLAALKDEAEGIYSSSGSVAINADKRKRQISAAATRSDMEQILRLLQTDLQQLEDGLKRDMCDKAEVQKAKDLMEAAKQRMSRLPDRAPTPAEQTVMSVNMLI